MAEFIDKGLGGVHGSLFIGAQPVVSHADLREFCQLTCKGFSLLPCCAVLNNPVCQAHCQGLVSAYRPAGEDEVHGSAQTDEPGQADGAAVYERNPPPAAEHPEHRGFFHDPQVAEAGKLQSAGNGISGNSCNHRFSQKHPGRAHGRITGLIYAVNPLVINANGLEIRSCAEMSSGTGEYCDMRFVISIKGPECIGKIPCGRSVHGISHLGPVDDDGADILVLFHDHVHNNDLL